MARSSVILMLVLTAITALYFSRAHIGQSYAPLFELTDPEKTGVKFTNTVKERPGFNVLESEFFFNGGGVAIGDINNDGLPDIYLTANMGSNALYLNQGGLRFQNITEQAGVSDAEGWSAGVTMVDINSDGLLDIYICKTGAGEENERRNKLFINNGDLTFTERAEEYGLDDPGYSTHAAFFDYDRDGDLDMFLVNYSVKRYNRFNIVSIRNKVDPYAGDKLFRNDNGLFTDVSRRAGIIRNPIGFGLSGTVSDVNMDGWPDIYVANDYMEKDYLYVNQQNGTFREEVTGRTTHISYFSMGSDIADFNNDTFPDIITADMLPDNYERMRVFKGPDYHKYHQLAYSGYHRQNMRNMLQMNNGDGTFTEVGQLVHISKTDWSWAVLLADYDNDGLKDLYITNGFPRDYTNLDYLNNVLWKYYPEEEYQDDPEKLYDLVMQMPEVKLHNHAFKNQGGLSFTSSGKAWGLDQYAVSNGAAYGDLDNDGDLDLIVNNINEHAFLYKNNSRELNSNNFLKVRLIGSEQNTFGVGAKVKVTGPQGRSFFQEAFPARGYQSSVEPVLLFGLGSLEQVDVEVIWSDQTREIIHDVSVNQAVTVNKANAAGKNSNTRGNPGKKMFVLLDEQKLGFDFSHEGSAAQDMIRAPLLPHTLTNLGPALAHGDVNNDGLSDIFVGGGKDQAAKLYLQQNNGRFKEAEVPFFELHKQYEDTGALFFEANGDGNVDLYVASGGNSDPTNSAHYQDRLYINDGFGRFFYDSNALPTIKSSGGCITAADFDGDTDRDLFVGGRVLTGKYPYPPRSYLLENNNSIFTDITSQASPDLLSPGMISDAVWINIDRDHYPGLALAGEWMPVRIFRNNRDKTFTEITVSAGMEKTAGWWNSLEAADMDGDGNTDLIAGNRGLNAALEATPQKPVILYAGDFDGNGFIDPLITQIIEENRYPVPGRDQLLQQLPHLKEKFPDYSSYAKATISEILTEKQLRDASRFYTHTFASTIFKNKGDGTFQAVALPHEAQIFPLYDMIIADFNGDRTFDILAAGNNFGTKAKNGPIAGIGILLTGDGQFGFKVHRAYETGFRATGEVRNMEVVSSPLGSVILLARNGGTPVPYLYQSPNRQKQH